MILKLSDLESKSRLECDVCIVGAGVAGQTLAMTLTEEGIDVILCESGQRDFDFQIQDLARGKNIGETYYDLHTARLRLFGGTAAIWGGRCAELDEIDFEKRSFVPHSGWPISKKMLDPYYDKIFQSLDLRRPSTSGLWEEVTKTKPAFHSNCLETGLWSFDENGERFTDPNRGTLKRVRTILQATLTELDVSDSGYVNTAHFKDFAKNTISVKAKKFVLAAGAMETVRLLKGAVPARPKGFGNYSDQLGRFFMEHPHARGGQILSSNMAQVVKSLPRAVRYKKKRYAAYLRPSETFQKEKQILNSSLSFGPRRHAGLKKSTSRSVKDKLKHDLPSTKFWRSTYRNFKAAKIRVREKTEPLPTLRKVKRSDTFGLYAIVRAEQSPNPDSRIILSGDRDPFGLPRLEFDWQLKDIDKRSVRVLMEILRTELRKLGWGDVELAPWLETEDKLWDFDPLISGHHIGGYHHLGGTRMSDMAKTGVKSDSPENDIIC